MENYRFLFVGSSSEIARLLTEEYHKLDNVKVKNVKSSSNFECKEEYYKNIIDEAEIFFVRSKTKKYKNIDVVIFFNGEVDRELPHNIDMKTYKNIFEITLFAPIEISNLISNRIKSQLNFVYLGSSIATHSASTSVYYSTAKSALYAYCKNMNYVYAKVGKFFFYYDLGFLGVGLNRKLPSKKNDEIAKRSAVNQFVKIGDLAKCIVGTVGNPGLSGSKIKVDNGYS